MSRGYCYLLYTTPPVTTNGFVSTKEENIIMLGAGTMFGTKKWLFLDFSLKSKITQRVDCLTYNEKPLSFLTMNLLKNMKIIKNSNI